MNLHTSMKNLVDEMSTRMGGFLNTTSIDMLDVVAQAAHKGDIDAMEKALEALPLNQETKIELTKALLEV